MSLFNDSDENKSSNNFLTPVSSLSNRPVLDIIINGHKLRCLFDSGAAISAINSSAAAAANVKSHTPTTPLSPLQGANGLFIPSSKVATPSFTIHNTTYTHTLRLIPNLNVDVILGIDFIKQHDVHIKGGAITVGGTTSLFAVETNYSTHVFTDSAVSLPPYSVGTIKFKTPFPDSPVFLDPIDPSFAAMATIAHSDSKGHVWVSVSNTSHERLSLPQNHRFAEATQFQEHSNINIISSSSSPPTSTPPTSPPLPTSPEDIINRMNLPSDPETRKMYTDLIRRYIDVFASSELDIGWSDAVSHRINLDSKSPIFTKQFKIPLAHQEVIEQYVEDLLQRNLIETARSRYNSPIFCVKKKNGKWRPVIDLRKVNKHTVDDFYSIKDIRTCLDTVGSARPSVFSSMDMQSGFFQQNLDPTSRPYTAFTVPHLGQYQFRVSCFGAHGAPSSFSALVDHVFSGLRNLVTYIDDLLAFTRSHKHQLSVLEETFRRLREANLKLNPEKCNFGLSSVEYLGYILDKDGIRPTHDKLDIIRHTKPPVTPKQIRQFLGLAGFFREHIHHFAHKSSLLSRLNRKDSTWSKGPIPDTALEAFNQLKSDLLSSPLISYARPELPYQLYCDAATGTADGQRTGGLGAVLTQTWPEDGKQRVIGYASRQTKNHESRYSPTNLEMTAIVFGITHFHHYLYGAKTFKVFTDHKPIADSQSKSAETKDKTLLRLQDKLLPYNFDVVYRPGKEMGAPDFLSRAHAENARVINVLEEEEDAGALEILDLRSSQVEKAQREDKLWGPLLSALESGTTPPPRYSSVPGTPIRVNNVLFFADHKRMKLAVPESLIPQVLSMCHDSALAGHKDATKTLHRLRHNFMVHNATTRVKTYVQYCHTCQISKSYEKSTNPMATLPTPSMFNERIHIDLVGPLHSNSGHAYVLTIRDAFSRYQQFAALKDKSATSVASALITKWIAPFGPPTSMTSDNGKEFTNQVISSLCKQVNIHQIFCTPYYPQGNGLGERQHRELNDYLRAILDSSSDWPTHLDQAALAHNTQFNEAIGHTPYYAVFLRDHPGIFDRLTSHQATNHWSSKDVSNMLHARFATRQNVAKATEKQRAYYNKKAKLQLFRPGDLVLRWNEKAGTNIINRKLKPCWTGPYIVTDVDNASNTVKISSPSGNKVSRVNKNKLKFYFATDKDTKPGQGQQQKHVRFNLDPEWTPVPDNFRIPSPPPRRPPTPQPSPPPSEDSDSEDDEPASGSATSPDEFITPEEEDDDSGDHPDPGDDSGSYNLRDRSSLQPPVRYRSSFISGRRSPH